MLVGPGSLRLLEKAVKRLRIVHEPWQREFPYVVEEYDRTEWSGVAYYASQGEAEADAEVRVKGPKVIKEYNPNQADLWAVFPIT
jgi:hypothetical protein